jgi:hypothetical protein
VAVQAGLGDENSDWGGAGDSGHGRHERLPQQTGGLAEAAEGGWQAGCKLRVKD